ncbi:hypothetical protein Ddye_024398 [Dipteronia dyeriana]|uniref:RNase H type-1 domain-containing protein n=1 Tax=Dipteronia dyeriana TaxID=168575 RepID=A0AAD9TUQ4_9ROSI|nr:hypothetical protein Ddye_024398 [Dipteronia dyeriana]
MANRFSLALEEICEEGLSQLISKAHLQGDLLGFKCNRFGLTITHLFFADDSLLFCKANSSNCVAIRSLLEDCAKASEQVINFEKSAMCSSVMVNEVVYVGDWLVLGEFATVRQVLSLTYGFGGRCLVVEILLESRIPMKVKVFIWKACNNWIPTRLNLARKALDKASRVVGIGIVIRDSKGLVTASSCQRIIATYAPHMAETVALYRGLLLAYEVGCFEVDAESDAVLVINWVSDGKVVDSDKGLILKDILSLSRQMGFCSFKFTSRECNYVSHCLAKLALSFDFDRVWIEEFPPCVTRLPVVDCPSCL